MADSLCRRPSLQMIFIKETMTAATKKSLHITLQGKGGVGKSLVSMIVAQYLLSIGTKIECVDIDPVNQTFAGFKNLNVSHVNIMDGAKINERHFDSLMERLLSEDATFVVDSGSPSFIPVSSYMAENGVIDMLESSDRDVVIHTVITGGQAQVDTLTGFDALAKNAKDQSIIVWLNEFFGDIAHEGKTFAEMKIYDKHKTKIRGIVRIAKRNQDTFGKDIEQMALKRLTFAEVLDSASFQLMAKQRLVTVKKDLFGQLEAIGF